MAHGLRVVGFSLQLFDATRSLHRLGSWEREMLGYAALLHDVGARVNRRKHQRHSYYLIVHADLEGFSAEEIALLAALARFHKGEAPSDSHKAVKGLSAAARRVLRPLVALLRVGDGLDRTHRGSVAALRVSRRAGRTKVLVEARGGNAALEVWAAIRKAKLWDEHFGEPVVFAVDGRAVSQNLLGRVMSA